MNTYIFITRVSNSLEIAVRADSEENAYVELEKKIAAAEQLNIRLPGVHTWSISTAY